MYHRHWLLGAYQRDAHGHRYRDVEELLESCIWRSYIWRQRVGHWSDSADNDSVYALSRFEQARPSHGVLDEWKARCRQVTANSKTSDTTGAISADISRSEAAQQQDDMLPSDCPGLTGSRQFASKLSNETYDVDNSKMIPTDISRSDAAQPQDDMLQSDCPGPTGSRQFASELSTDTVELHLTASITTQQARYLQLL